MLAIAFVLFVVGAGDMPTLTALAAYPSKEECTAAAAAITGVLAKGDSPQIVACFPSEALKALGDTMVAPAK